MIQKQLKCYYCTRKHALKEARITNPPQPAQVTVHDFRGCLHVCWPRAIWRSTTSGSITGHSDDCAAARAG
jgi:hypothetical protein